MVVDRGVSIDGDATRACGVANLNVIEPGSEHLIRTIEQSGG